MPVSALQVEKSGLIFALFPLLNNGLNATFSKAVLKALATINLATDGTLVMHIGRFQ